MSGDLEGIEEIAAQTSVRVNERVKRGKIAWDIPPNLEHTHVERDRPLAPVIKIEISEPVQPPEPIVALVTTYTELMAAIQAQVGALGLKLSDFDDLAGFPSGLSGKVFGLLQVKRLGPEKVFDAIRAAGLRLRVEVDPDQEAKMKQRIMENYNPRQANQARNGHSASPAGPAVMSRIFKPLAKMGGKARMAKMSKEELRAHQRHAAMAGVMKRRKAERKKRKANKHRRQREKQAKVQLVAI